MALLNYDVLKKSGYDGYILEDAPVKVLQFGEGNFLRAFVDYWFDLANEKAGWNGKCCLVQPIAPGLSKMINEQEGLYTLYLRGSENGKKVDDKRVISSVANCLNPYEKADYDKMMEVAASDDLQIIVSNTTEAGTAYLGTEKLDDKPAKSYPAKLTQFLYKRFQTGLKGFILLPCELIDHNADTLKECVLKYADLWELGDEFKNWLLSENDFCNTLVDRIVTGYPRTEAADICKELGYTDNLIDTAEIFHLWVIQGHHEDELPFNKAGYNIVWTDDVAPYKKRKVRILNGGHTSMVLGAYLYGLETVGECLKDETVSNYLKHCIFEEIVPTLGNTQTDIDFGKAVLERFANPFIRHMLLSIALNSVSKFQVRVLPTILEHKEKFGNYPEGLVMSMAALIAFYRTDKANDGAEIMEFMKTASVEDIMKREDYWHADLTEMIPMVQKYYDVIEKDGMKAAYDVVLNK